MRSAVLPTLLALAVLASPALADRGAARHAKPGAPVRLTVTSREAGGARVVVLDAVPTRDVPAIELRVGDRTARFGATRAGEHRVLEAPLVIPAGGGVDVIATARLGAAGHVRSQTVVTRFGAAAATAKVQPFTLRTVNGRPVAEVRE